MKFSANLGFLWSELPLVDAIHAAKAAGFDAVECHWPYDTPATEVAKALAKTDLRMLGINTSRGNAASGENGLAALPGRETQARQTIDQALNYADAINTPNVHVMAGVATGRAAQDTFINNLEYACEQAAKRHITILIEPLNHVDAPGYFLQTTGQAHEIINTIARPNLKLMFDCYHVQLIEGDITRRLRALAPIIGHIQFASVPDRGPPGAGALDYGHVFDVLAKMGWASPLGAEYKTNGPTEQSLSWMRRYQIG